MISMLEPIFQGKWAPYGESLRCYPEQHGQYMSLESYLQHPEWLYAALQRYADHFQCSDKHATTSIWALDYFTALIPPMVAATSILQHSFPVTGKDIALVLNDSGAPIAFSLAHTGQSSRGKSTAERYHALLWQHLQPLIQVLSHYSRLSAKVLWASVPRYIPRIFELGAAYRVDRQAAERDQEALLRKSHWADGRTNPLYGSVRMHRLEINGKIEQIKIFKHCCLYYRLSDQQFCGACPLSCSPSLKKPASATVSFIAKPAPTIPLTGTNAV